MLLSVVALLTAPAPEDPQDAEVAKQYISNRKLYNKTAAYWTKMYANPKAAAAAEEKASKEARFFYCSPCMPACWIDT